MIKTKQKKEKVKFHIITLDKDTWPLSKEREYFAEKFFSVYTKDEEIERNPWQAGLFVMLDYLQLLILKL